MGLYLFTYVHSCINKCKCFKGIQTVFYANRNKWFLIKYNNIVIRYNGNVYELIQSLYIALMCYIIYVT